MHPEGVNFRWPTVHVFMGFYCTLKPTDDYGNPCDVHQSPFINNCSYSAAYNLLNHIYGDIKYANSSSAVADNVG